MKPVIIWAVAALLVALGFSGQMNMHAIFLVLFLGTVVSAGLGALSFLGGLRRGS